ncbi:hypothetical protein ACIQ6V_29985, partial [Streptomyces sp. NPDC096198]
QADPQDDSDAPALSDEDDDSDHADHDHHDHHHDGPRTAPSGGVRAGGGALSQATGGSGLAAGSILLLGGLGAGAYMLRRRNVSGTAGA